MRFATVAFSISCALAALPLAAATAMTSNTPATTNTSSGGTSATAGLMAQAQAAVDAGDYANAIAALNQVVAAEPGNADALNLLGYSTRSLDRFTEAMGFYERALAIDPEHLGANEYYGELLIKMGDIEGAQERLAVLDEVCFLGCDEYDALAEAIDAYMNAE
ncbi:MAG: tetratricopeptide repeat protein [Alphaproteobacteria bacterium]